MIDVTVPRTAEGNVHIETYRRQQVLGELLGSFLGAVWLWAVRSRTRRAQRRVVS